jgi:Ca-activated chloride channel family protein
MSFHQPLVLLGLAFIPLLVAFYLATLRRRRRYVMRFTNLALLQSVSGPRPGWRRHLPPALFIAGLAALGIGLAGPILNLEVQRNNASVMLVIDTSGSMQATDVQPTRLQAAQAAARTLINALPSNDRVGLISFSRAAILQAPLGTDRTAVGVALDSLRANGSTAIGDAIDLAVQQLAPNGAAASGSRRPPAMIILLTDGASNAGIDPATAANDAAAAGIPVNTIGIGSRDGNVAVRGQEVGPVDEQTLQAVAAATGGRYFYAAGAGQLQQIYSNLGAQFSWQFVPFDLTLPVLILAVLVLVAGATLSLAWFRVVP